jgi:23S rRNA pseudouridine2605 synthase
MWYNGFMRLNKYIAEQAGVSRRQADEMIASGQVSIVRHSGLDPESSQTVAWMPDQVRHDKAKIAELGQRVDEDTQVFINGKLISTRAKHTTILLNKPVGYLSSRRSQGGDPTVYDLLPAKFRTLKTAGRLDKDSSGLMILSSDGDLIQSLTHPRYQKTKIYQIKLDKALAPLHQQMISDIGIDLPDGKSKFYLDCFDDKSSRNDRTTWRVTMHEGRNRQIRRTFAALGYKVTKLHRTNLGPYALGDLKSGNFREISVEY